MLFGTTAKYKTPGGVPRAGIGCPLQVRLMEFTKHAAITDALTGVYNRRFFDDMFEKQLALAKRSNEPLSILLADLDHFKKLK